MPIAVAINRSEMSLPIGAEDARFPAIFMVSARNKSARPATQRWHRAMCRPGVETAERASDYGRQKRCARGERRKCRARRKAATPEKRLRIYRRRVRLLQSNHPETEAAAQGRRRREDVA